MNKRFKVYLAGGLKTNWREKVIKAVPNADYFDPMELANLPSLGAIVEIEVDWLNQSDIVFAYWEADNLCPIGLAAEGSWAREATCILCVDPVEDHVRRAQWLARFWETDVRTFEEGIEELRRICDKSGL